MRPLTLPTCSALILLACLAAGLALAANPSWHGRVTRANCQPIHPARRPGDAWPGRLRCGKAYASTAAPTSAPAASTTASQPAAYPTLHVEGWTVHINPHLRNDHPDLAAQALKLLADDLYRITRAVPGAALPRLKTIGIYLEYNSSPFKGAVYHTSAAYLRTHGVNPVKARCVEITDVRNFLQWNRPYRSMVLHELAHAWHHQMLGYDDARVVAAYRNAMDHKLYDRVLNIGGGTGQAYAAKNAQEYFAELSEAYFGTNDFYPFVRGELAAVDPQGYRMIVQAWNIPPPPASQPAASQP